MSPSIILAITAILLIIGYGLYKFTSMFCRDITAKKALKLSTISGEQFAKRQVEAEWSMLQTAIKQRAKTGFDSLPMGHLYIENIHRLRQNGFEVIDNVGIQWSKKG